MDWFLYDNDLRYERIKEGDSSNRQKIVGCFLCLFQQILRQNVTWFLS